MIPVPAAVARSGALRRVSREVAGWCSRRAANPTRRRTSPGRRLGRSATRRRMPAALPPRPLSRQSLVCFGGDVQQHKPVSSPTDPDAENLVPAESDTVDGHALWLHDGHRPPRDQPPAERRDDQHTNQDHGENALEPVPCTSCADLLDACTGEDDADQQQQCDPAACRPQHQSTIAVELVVPPLRIGLRHPRPLSSYVRTAPWR